MHMDNWKVENCIIAWFLHSFVSGCLSSQIGPWKPSPKLIHATLPAYGVPISDLLRSYGTGDSNACLPRRCVESNLPAISTSNFHLRRLWRPCCRQNFGLNGIYGQHRTDQSTLACFNKARLVCLNPFQNDPTCRASLPKCVGTGRSHPAALAPFS